MLFVNNSGDFDYVAAPFAHADWNGLTFADLVFPTFLFVLGASSVYSIERRREAGVPLGILAFQVFVRGTVLVLLGWLLALFPFGIVAWIRGEFAGAPGGSLAGWWDNLTRLASHARLTGVLPRIGVVSIGVGWLLLGVRRGESIAAAAAVLLGIHAHLLMGMGLPLDPDDNVQRSVDDALLSGHLYTREETDPEGIVSTLSATATALCGAIAALTLRSPVPDRVKGLRLIAGGAAGVLLGCALAAWIPVNKKLWTPSFALLSAGIAAAALEGSRRLVALAARGGHRIARGFVAAATTFGRNALTAFLASEALAILLIHVRLPRSDGRRETLHSYLYGGMSWIPYETLRSHAFALLFVAAFYALLHAMERRGWYWKA